MKKTGKTIATPRAPRALGASKMPSATRSRMSPEERREHFITEAISFFTEHGFKGTTRQLSERLGVTQPLLYKYFPAKRDLIDAVYERIYLRRLKPHWTTLIIDRNRPIVERMTQFYIEYADAVLTREWVRLFVFAGLQGEDINDRYLGQLERTIIRPLLSEITFAAREAGGPRAKVPTIDDIWAHHGSVFYFGIREHIYGVDVSADRRKTIVAAVQRFLDAFTAQPSLLLEPRSSSRVGDAGSGRAY